MTLISGQLTNPHLLDFRQAVLLPDDYLMLGKTKKCAADFSQVFIDKGKVFVIPAGCTVQVAVKSLLEQMEVTSDHFLNYSLTIITINKILAFSWRDIVYGKAGNEYDILLKPGDVIIAGFGGM